MPGSNHNGAIGSETWPGLTKLLEECGETVQVIGKILAFPESLRDKHPDGTFLVPRLEEELGDVLAAIDYVMAANDVLDNQAIEMRRHRKLDRFLGWHNEERARHG